MRRRPCRAPPVAASCPRGTLHRRARTRRRRRRTCPRSIRRRPPPAPAPCARGRARSSPPRSTSGSRNTAPSARAVAIAPLFRRARNAARRARPKPRARSPTACPESRANISILLVVAEQFFLMYCVSNIVDLNKEDEDGRRGRGAARADQGALRRCCPVCPGGAGASCCGSAGERGLGSGSVGVDWTGGGYSAEELGGLPEAVGAASLGCGNPTALATLSPGEVVLDLGSGGG